MHKNSLEKIDFMIHQLNHFSDKDILFDCWLNGKGPGYYEDSLTWGDAYPYFKTLVRDKELELTKEQIKSILRIDVMINTFDRILNRSEVPCDWDGEHQYILNHPYWIKTMAQAKYALSLLNK